MNEISIYQTENGTIEVQLRQDTVWLRQEQLSQLFGRERSVITKHLRNVFTEGELEANNAVCAKFAHSFHAVCNFFSISEKPRHLP